MGFAWKFLLPLALINLVITALEVVYWQNLSPWIFVVVNWVVAIVLILVWSRTLKFGGGRVEVLTGGETKS